MTDARGKPTTSCQELSRFIGDLIAEAENYARKRGRAYVYWIIAQAVSLLAGFGGALLGATNTGHSDRIRIATAVFSALAAFASTVMVQLRLYELWRLREDVEPVYQKLVEDGRRLAAVGYDGAVHLWDPATGHNVLVLRPPGGDRRENLASDSQVVFSRDGTRLAANNWAKRILVWDGRPLPRENEQASHR